MGRIQEIMRGQRNVILILCLIAGLVFSAASVIGAQPHVGITSLRASPMSQAPSTHAPVIKGDALPDSRASQIGDRLRERLEAVRSGAGEPSQVRSPHKARQRNRAASVHDEVGSDVEVRFRPHGGTPRQIKVKPHARRRGVVLHEAVSGARPGKDRDKETARAFLKTRRGLLRISNPDKEMELSRYEKDDLGRRHLRYRQKYRGLPVWPAEVNVHLDREGNVDLMNGAFVPTPRRLITEPVLDAEDAVARAREAVADGADAVAGESELIVYGPGDRSSRLAWKVGLAVSVEVNWLVVIDALNGAVLTTFNQVQTENVVGSGVGLFGNTRQLNLWPEGGKYYLVDTSKPMYDVTSDPPAVDKTRGAIIVADMANTELPAQGGAFDASYITSANPNSGWLPEGVSLAYCLSECYDYYLNRHGRNSIDGKGGTALGFVRVGQNYKNAFWQPEYKAMFFGDGKPYAGALDVIGHELTHGVTNFTCNLVYRDQSGALNEAFSDIFGEMIEAYTTGSTDWADGTLLGGDPRQLRDPASQEVIAGSGYKYPAKMSQFYGRNHPLLQQLVNQDNGGVHINMTIVSHAFYLLAEGLAGAIGMEDAARVFYRAQTVHLVANSQFIDVRLACVTAAEEIWQGDQAKQTAVAAKIKEAFDAVEIFDDAATPAPPPTQPVSGDDAEVFVYYDWYWGAFFLGGCEPGRLQECLQLSYWDVMPSRPSVTGDGSSVFFVDSINDACFIATDGSEVQEACLDSAGLISSVAMSPDGQVYGFVLLDEHSKPTNTITVIDLRPGGETREFPLVAPGTEGASVNTVQYADAMDFTSDNRYLAYDAYNILELQDGTKIGVWSIYAIDLETEQIFALIQPMAEADIGYPAFSQTTNFLMTFDVVDASTGNSTVVAMNLLTGEAAEIGGVLGSWGVPGYNGDDTAIVYSQSDTQTNLSTFTGFSLVSQPLEADGITAAGSPSLLLPDADFGVIYRRGAFTLPQPDISTSDASLSFEEVAAGASAGKSLTISNTGTANLLVIGLSLSGDHASEFSIEGGCGGQTLPASGTCTLMVRFSPTAEGAKTASLSIESDDPETPEVNVPVTGTGLPAARHTIRATTGAHGAIEPAGDVLVDHGSDQVFAMVPEAGYGVADVVLDDVSQGSAGAYTFANVTQDHTIHVTFCLLNTYYRDQDQDTYGDPVHTTEACSKPAGYVADDTDCDDRNGAVHPGATELCNGTDDDCDHETDEGCGATHFGSVTGNTADPKWTIYLSGATLDGVDLESGDEIAVYDGEILVGGFRLAGVLTMENQFNNYLTAWSTLAGGLGYTPGNAYTFKCWDASAQKEYRGLSVTLGNPLGDSYTGNVFPDGDGPYSIAELSFTSKWIRGDINGDEKVDLRDLMLALQVSAGLVPAETVHVEGDVNEDGRIGLDEAAYVARLILGI